MYEHTTRGYVGHRCNKGIRRARWMWRADVSRGQGSNERLDERGMQSCRGDKARTRGEVSMGS